MKVVLVIPDSVDLQRIHPARTLKKAADQAPLGALYVAAAAEQAGHEVRIVDNYLEEEKETNLVQRILDEKPECVGFSAAILNIWQGLSVAAKIKAIEPGIRTVFGGPQPTIDPMRTLAGKGVDFVVRGEGEEIFVELIDRLSRKRGSAMGLPGVLFKDADGTVRGEPVPRPAAPLAGRSLPARHLLDLSSYHRVGGGLLTYPVDLIASSRGCSFQCAFCSSAEYWNRTYRVRPPKQVVDEMERMIETLGTRGFYFREDNFTLSRKHVLGICEEIVRRKLNVPWECESRVDTLSREVMARMAEAGCRFIWCGVESGSQRVLDSICKGITVEKIRSFYKNARELGIRTSAGFMIGIPGETEEDVERSKDLAAELETDYVGFLSYVAFPGSPLYDRVCREKLFSAQWESILFVETEFLSRTRVLELEQDLNRLFRRRRMVRRPVRTLAAAVRARISRNGRLFAKARHLAMRS